MVTLVVFIIIDVGNSSRVLSAIESLPVDSNGSSAAVKIITDNNPS
jgi:hypothetical protein